MNAINSNLSSSYTPPASTVSGAADTARLQQQAQAQKAQQLEQAKPANEQVSISQQAQQLLAKDTAETGSVTAQNAVDRNEPSASSSSKNTSTTSTTSTTNTNATNNNPAVNTEQALDTAKTVQNRQTATALAQYSQQQSAATQPKVAPPTDAEQKPTTSIKALA